MGGLREDLCGLPWFETKAEQTIFEKMEYACVYAVGTDKGRPLKVSSTKNLIPRLYNIQAEHWRPIIVHEIVWTAGSLLANALEIEIYRLLDKANRRIRGAWFDVPVEMIVPTFQVATDNLKMKTFTHRQMLDDISLRREHQIASALKGL
jgi:hypothetical protein